MKTRKAKIMALMAAATLSIFSAGSVMAAENGDFYPQPVNSDWEDAHTEGAYASFTNGSDYVNIYKYALDDAKIGVAKCNDTYEACYQTIFSEGNSLYMAVGYARDADDIGEVRKMVESISYPGNPTLTGKDGKADLLITDHRKTAVPHLLTRIRMEVLLQQIQQEAIPVPAVLILQTAVKILIFFLQPI